LDKSLQLRLQYAWASLRPKAFQPFNGADDDLLDSCDIGAWFPVDTCARQHRAPHLQFILGQASISFDHRQSAFCPLLDLIKEWTASLSEEGFMKSDLALNFRRVV